MIYVAYERQKSYRSQNIYIYRLVISVVNNGLSSRVYSIYLFIHEISSKFRRQRRLNIPLIIGYFD